MGKLAGLSILVIEDEPLIALDLVQNLQDAGARVIRVHTGGTGVPTVPPKMFAAIIDHSQVRDENEDHICDRLTELDIPFIIYSGFTHFSGTCLNGVHLDKPATAAQLVNAVAGLFGR